MYERLPVKVLRRRRARLERRAAYLEQQVKRRMADIREATGVEPHVDVCRYAIGEISALKTALDLYDFAIYIEETNAARLTSAG